MRRVVVDSNAVDPILDIPGAYKVLRTAVLQRELDLMFTHVNIDELAATSDPERRSRLLLVLIALGRLVPTGAFALDVSRLDHARLNEDVQVFEALRSGNIDHTRDALIAATARVERCAIVTNEKRLRGRCQAEGIEVLTTRDLLAEFGFDL